MRIYIYILRGWGDKYFEGWSGKKCREGCLGWIYAKGKREETNVYVLCIYISIKKSTAAALPMWTATTGDGETDISIAKGFDNQKGHSAAVTARGIRSFRNANLWTKYRRRRDDNIAEAPADCRVSGGSGIRGEGALWKSSSGKSREKWYHIIYYNMYYIPCGMYLYI